jgi:tetratricopeptide (TPR) repeat protein
VDAEEAVAQLERSIGEGADAPVILTALLELQYQRGRSADASRTVDRLREEYPDDPSSLLAVARRDIAKGRSAVAAAALREAVVARESFRAEELLALAEYRLGNLEAASCHRSRSRADARLLPRVQRFGRGSWWPRKLERGGANPGGAGAESRRLSRQER